MVILDKKGGDNWHLPFYKELQLCSASPAYTPYWSFKWPREVHIEGATYSVPCLTEPDRPKPIQIPEGQKRKGIIVKPHNATKRHTSVRGLGRKREVKS